MQQQVSLLDEVLEIFMACTTQFDDVNIIGNQV
jgi:hypothetical protein